MNLNRLNLQILFAKVFDLFFQNLIHFSSLPNFTSINWVHSCSSGTIKFHCKVLKVRKGSDYSKFGWWMRIFFNLEIGCFDSGRSAPYLHLYEINGLRASIHNEKLVSKIFRLEYFPEVQKDCFWNARKTKKLNLDRQKY